jgi:hypothetical protein
MPINSYSRKLAPPGDEPYARIKWQGPASYARVATPGLGTATAGDPFPAAIMGIQEVVAITFAATYTGNFEVVPVRVTGGTWILMWRALTTATVGGQAQTSGTEAAVGTNLSAEYVTLEIMSRTA